MTKLTNPEPESFFDRVDKRYDELGRVPRNDNAPVKLCGDECACGCQETTDGE